ncbi:MAG: hypothetical protein KAI66_03710 [Lentisphaeria bacterium]|nr:hypothetical protein [Lentisphaeria bacterium]
MSIVPTHVFHCGAPPSSLASASIRAVSRLVALLLTLLCASCLSTGGSQTAAEGRKVTNAGKAMPLSQNTASGENALRISFFQTTMANRRCSMFTSMLTGPVVARGRNEGLLKNTREIARMLPFWALKLRLAAGRETAGGRRWENYKLELRNIHNTNLFPETWAVLDAVSKDRLAREESLRWVERNLCQSGFLSAKTLVVACRNGAISTTEGRKLFWAWFKKGNYLGDGVNLYLLPGNQHMMTELLDAGILAQDEAQWMMRIWVVKLSRLEASFLGDLDRLGVLEQPHWLALVEREKLLLLLHAGNRLGHEIKPHEELEARLKTVEQEIRSRRRALHKVLSPPKTVPTWIARKL